MNKPVVLQVVPELDAGGVERGTVDLANELVRRNFESIVISAGGRLVEPLEGAGSRHITLPVAEKRLRGLMLVGRIRQLLMEERVDILHLRSRFPAWVFYLAWRKMDPSKRPRLVTTVHGLYSVSRYSRIMTVGEKVIAVSETARRYILDSYRGVDEKRIVVIPRGVDKEIFHSDHQPSAEWISAWESEHPSIKTGAVLTLAGRLTRLKGHRDFIHLIHRLVSEGHSVHGLIVGGEDPRRREYAAELYSLVNDLGLDSQVTFLGHRSDLREIYSISNVVYSLSKQPESFGRTVVEALSMGVPVIGLDHGGVGEVLNKIYPFGRVGLGDDDALFDKTVTTIENAPKIPEFDAYSLQGMLDNTIDVYRQLLS